MVQDADNLRNSHGNSIAIMTFNVYMNRFANTSAANCTSRAILESNADVVCLQESNKGWRGVLENCEGLFETYPHRCFRDDMGNYGGRAVLSKYAINESQWSDRLYNHWYGALRVSINAIGRIIQILIVHHKAPFPSNPWTVQHERMEEIKAHLGRVKDQNLMIIVGDFNNRSGPSH